MLLHMSLTPSPPASSSHSLSIASPTATMDRSHQSESSSYSALPPSRGSGEDISIELHTTAATSSATEERSAQPMPRFMKERLPSFDAPWKVARPKHIGLRWKVCGVLAACTLLFLFIQPDRSRLDWRSATTAAATSIFPPTTTKKDCGSRDFECQAAEAQAYFDKLQASQSRSLEEAKQTYRKRYGRTPPRGFDAWYQFAKSNNVTLLDEFDQIEVDLLPFRHLSRQHLVDRMASALEQHEYTSLGKFAISYLAVKDGVVHLGGSQKWWLTDVISQLLDPVAKQLPDTTILYNWYDEARGILPARIAQDKSDVITYHENLRQDAWDALRASCPDGTSPLQTTKFQRRPARFSSLGDSDICKLSPEAQRQHGLFQAPTNFHPADKLVPMLSYGKVSTMSDILSPALCYWADGLYATAVREDQKPFKDKKKDVYWRGSLSGMIMKEGQWHTGHRERFVQYSQALLNASHALKTRAANVDKDALKTESPYVGFLSFAKEAAARQHLLSLPDGAFDVGITRLGTCDGACEQDFYRKLQLAEKQSSSESYNHQIVADLDGENMSCRFYRLMGSGSAVMKQTVYQEWHADRLIPWVHYIPLSLEMDELLPLVTWLLDTESGQAMAARIASASREWLQQSLRPIDGTVYFYRQLLEFDHLLSQSP